jgi:acetolactate synthase-1/2/3 large subunit
MVLFVGQVPTRELGRRSFQEVDYSSMFGDLAKDVLMPPHADRIPEIVARALDTAVAGEPGPVVVVLPEDILSARTDASVLPRGAQPASAPAPSEVDRVVELLARADRPLIVAGGTGWTTEATKQLQAFAETASIPVATATRHQDLMDNTSPMYAGTLGLTTTPGLGDLAAEADVVLLLGSRPDALTAADSQWLRAPEPTQSLVHVHPDPDVFNRVYRAALAITSTPAAFAAAIEARAESRPVSAWAERLRQNFELRFATPVGDGTDPTPYMAALNRAVPADTIMSAGAGSYTSWHQRFRQYVTFPSQISTQSGSMGFGLPAAIAAGLVHPDRTVVAWGGDGSFMMTAQEMATAVRYQVDLMVVVVNNNRYGTIRNHQDASYPGRVSGTDLTNPDFAAFAQSFGAFGRKVRTPEEFDAAVRDALGVQGPALIEIEAD